LEKETVGKIILKKEYKNIIYIKYSNNRLTDVGVLKNWLCKIEKVGSYVKINEKVYTE